MAQFFQAKKKPLVAQSVTLSISGMDHQGRGIAKHHNKVCFVDGALPNEQVKAKLVQDKARFSVAKTEKLLITSEYREPPFCPHYSLCGGCQLQHFRLDRQLVEKQIAVSQLFAKFSRIEDLPWQAPLQSKPKHYRRSARLAVMADKTSKRMKLGYRQQGSKNIISVTECAVLDEAFSAVFTVFDGLLNQYTGLKSVSHLQLCKSEQQSIIIIRHTKTINETLKSMVADVAANYDWQLIWQNESHVIDHQNIATPYYNLPEFDLKLEFSLNNFIQVNADVNHAMLKQAVEWLKLNGDEQVLDLFCGVGNFSLVLAKYVDSVVGIEGVDSAVAMAKQNAQTNSITNAQFHCFDLTEDMQSAPWFNRGLNKNPRGFDVLILDPSRTGAIAILEQLPLKQFKTILYVSCDPVTLARDSAIITQAGFSVEKIGLMNMFPHTGHIETMALFQRR